MAAAGALESCRRFEPGSPFEFGSLVRAKILSQVCNASLTYSISDGSPDIRRRAFQHQGVRTSDPRLTVDAVRELGLLRETSTVMTRMIPVLGGFVASYGGGRVFGALNTMYSAVVLAGPRNATCALVFSR